MNALSTFNGLGSIWIVLDKLGIKVDKRYSSEIDKYANIVNDANYPDTIQLGDITKIKGKDLEPIDLLVGGSPCQGFSFAGKQLNFEDPRSKLFFEFVRLLKETKPKYFLLENVKMKREYQDVISEYLGVEPIEINSSLVSAQNRRRLYWTNIPNVNQPDDKNIILDDIVENNIDRKYFYTDKYDYVYNGDVKVQCTLLLNGHRQAKEVYNLKGKCNTLLCDGNGGNLVKKIYQNGEVRKLTPLEYERLQTLPDNYTDGISDSRRYTAIGNGWTVDVISHILSFM